MSVQEKFIGEATMLEQPQGGLSIKLRDGAVTTPKLANRAVTEAKVDPALLSSLRTIDNAPTENSNNPVKSGGVYSALGTKQDTIEDLNTIRTNAQTGSISIQNIRNLMNACNEVFRIGFIGYHIEMSDNPNEQGNYIFNIVMNDNV